VSQSLTDSSWRYFQVASAPSAVAVELRLVGDRRGSFQARPSRRAGRPGAYRPQPVEIE
jgi:hypothetical protein